MELHEIKDRYRTLAARRGVLTEQLVQQKQELKDQGEEHQRLKESWVLLQAVADEAQNELKADVDGLVTTAIQSIFGDAYRFDLQIDRLVPNAPYKPVVWETVDGVENEYTPKDEMGGSMVDPIAFIFRVVLRSLDEDPCRNTFWLDEPMKNMGKGELLTNAGAMLVEVSHKLKLQLIIITHEPELAELADRAWQLTRPRGRTIVKKLEKAIRYIATKFQVEPKPKQKRRL